MNLNGSQIRNQDSIRRAILEAIIYGDIFDYPLKAAEIHRYLTIPASPDIILQILDEHAASGLLEHADGFYALQDRSGIIRLRQSRQIVAQRKWNTAHRFIPWLASTPYVRMIAVTGTLAVNNVQESDDIDLLIVTASGRLWLCRALVILTVRLAATQKIELCPNFFLSEKALVLEKQNFYNAREVVQMVPLYGKSTYEVMRSLNSWVYEFLPQASEVPPDASFFQLNQRQKVLKRSIEVSMDKFAGGRLENWEMQRKIDKLNRLAQQKGGNILLSANCCKGHFDGHDNTIMQMYKQRLTSYGLTREHSHG